MDCGGGDGVFFLAQPCCQPKAKRVPLTRRFLAVGPVCVFGGKRKKAWRSPTEEGGSVAASLISEAWDVLSTSNNISRVIMLGRKWTEDKGDKQTDIHTWTASILVYRNPSRL